MPKAAPVADEAYLRRLAGEMEVSPAGLLFVGRLLAAALVTHVRRLFPGVGRVSDPTQLAGWVGNPSYDVGRVGDSSCEPYESAGTWPGLCPDCGNTPGLASLRPGDGRRALHCSLCGMEWASLRLLCPFCAFPTPARIARVAVDGEQIRWIEACPTCHRYLKVRDLRERSPREPFSPLVEDVAGMYLDLLAEREGYLGNPPYAAVG